MAILSGADSSPSMEKAQPSSSVEWPIESARDPHQRREGATGDMRHRWLVPPARLFRQAEDPELLLFDGSIPEDIGDNAGVKPMSRIVPIFAHQVISYG
jgi:hypothetical protein